MPQLRVALAQVNTCVGDLTGNAEIVRRWTRDAAQAGAHVVVFPEMALTGYPVEDLALRASFVAASQEHLDRLAGELTEAGCGETLVIVGYLDGDEVGPRNAVAALYRGEVVARQFKHHLPNYGVFDEHRYFKPGNQLTVLRYRGLDLGMVICEDVWQDGGPIAALGRRGVDLILSPNASPYERDKDRVRLPLLARRAGEAGAAICYTNVVGGQDELVFDGDSMIVGLDGELISRAPQFVEHLLVTDLDLPTGVRCEVVPDPGFTVRTVTLSDDPLPGYEPAAPVIAEPLDDLAEMWGALVTGLRDYVHKNGFRSVVLGLSGGIDSAVVAAVAVDALGPDAVYGVSMPSVYSSDHSMSDAKEMANRTGLNYQVQPIADMVAAFVGPLRLTGLAEENVQARCRGVLLMGLSNQHGHLVLATGNKTELAVGYSTIYGDAVGGFAPIKDVSKTLVWELARWRNASAAQRGELEPIPANSITKPPSAELRPGQLDTDSLPDYAVLDDILDDYVEYDHGLVELLAAGFDEALVRKVLHLVDRAEYKRRQYPPGTKISFKAFGRDRRLPITNARKGYI
ncbi:NAD+ synthase [Pseudonocardiaceae bacterium YIM PH 21723]|nr:NAD+ synthase [Pseudonocardiaceae bacterium YIM PH 21723]